MDEPLLAYIFCVDLLQCCMMQRETMWESWSILVLSSPNPPLRWHRQDAGTRGVDDSGTRRCNICWISSIIFHPCFEAMFQVSGSITASYTMLILPSSTPLFVVPVGSHATKPQSQSWIWPDQHTSIFYHAGVGWTDKLLFILRVLYVSTMDHGCSRTIACCGRRHLIGAHFWLGNPGGFHPGRRWWCRPRTAQWRWRGRWAGGEFWYRGRYSAWRRGVGKVETREEVAWKGWWQQERDLVTCINCIWKTYTVHRSSRYRHTQILSNIYIQNTVYDVYIPIVRHTLTLYLSRIFAFNLSSCGKVASKTVSIYIRDRRNKYFKRFKDATSMSELPRCFAPWVWFTGLFGQV